MRLKMIGELNGIETEGALRIFAVRMLKSEAGKIISSNFLNKRIFQKIVAQLFFTNLQCGIKIHDLLRIAKNILASI